MITRTSHTKAAIICLALALVLAGAGIYCWLADPLYSKSEIGAGLSLLAAGTVLTVAFCFVLAGLVVLRQIVLALALVNLAVFAIAAKFLVRDSYIVTEQAIPDFIASTPWEIVFGILLVSIAISVAIYLLVSKRWSNNLASRAP